MSFYDEIDIEDMDFDELLEVIFSIYLIHERLISIRVRVEINSKLLLRN